MLNIIRNLFQKKSTVVAPMPKNSLSIYQKGLRLGTIQHAGKLSLIPIIGEDIDQERFVSPLSSIKVSKVDGYGNIELHNYAQKGTAIVPLHIGYIQQGAQNHALCRSSFIDAGQKLMFNDACCVQAAQGGYLKEKQQWFFILPIELRQQALMLRGKVGYNKLWNSISEVNVRHNKAARGHLDEIIVKMRADLNVFANRFELVEQQRGAIFFINNQYAGMEIAPHAAYFKEIFVPLVNFCYGPAALRLEQKELDKNTPKKPQPFAAKNLEELETVLVKSRKMRNTPILNNYQNMLQSAIRLRREEKFKNMELNTVTGNLNAGQVVVEDGRLIYASIFSRKI